MLFSGQQIGFFLPLRARVKKKLSTCFGLNELFYPVLNKYFKGATIIYSLKRSL